MRIFWGVIFVQLVSAVHEHMWEDENEWQEKINNAQERRKGNKNIKKEAQNKKWNIPKKY